MDINNFIDTLNSSNWPIFKELEKIPKDKNIYKADLVARLNKILIVKDEEKLEIILLVINQDGLVNEYTPVLCRLLEMDWHGLHEDIIMMLGDLQDARSVIYIKKLITKAEQVEEYHDLPNPLIKKCIWALGSIATTESFNVIKSLLDSRNFVTRETAELELRDPK